MKKLTYIVGASAIILLILFGWNESFDLATKINYQKFAAYFTCIGVLLAASTLFFLYNQLLAMERARKSVHQPNLYPAYVKFQVGDNYRMVDFEPTTFPTLNVYRIDDESPEDKKRPYIELHNIGLGAAKNITIQWDYDIAEVIQFIKGTYYYWQIDKPESEHFDFVIANGKIPISIPTMYFNCCGERLNKDMLGDIEPVTDKPKPNLKLNIVYSDIQDSPFNKCFNVEVNACQCFVDFKFYQDK